MACQDKNSDGGWLCPYWPAHVGDKHGCFYGTIGPLEAFGEVSLRNRTKVMNKAIERGAEVMLMHRLFKADHHDYHVIGRIWLKQSFPLFYNYSILRGLDGLAKLGYLNNPRSEDPLEILLRKRTEDGVWILERTPRGCLHANIETVGKPSKWITLIALRILRISGRLRNEKVGQGIGINSLA